MSEGRRQLLALVLVGPWGPPLASLVFAALVMGLGEQADPSFRALVETLGMAHAGAFVLVPTVVAAAVGVALAPHRGVTALHAACLLPSTVWAVAGATALTHLPETFAWDGAWTPPARTAQGWAVGLLVAGLFGAASLRMWRRHAASTTQPSPTLDVAPDDRRAFGAVAVLSAVAVVGWLVG